MQNWCTTSQKISRRSPSHYIQIGEWLYMYDIFDGQLSLQHMITMNISTYTTLKPLISLHPISAKKLHFLGIKPYTWCISF